MLLSLPPNNEPIASDPPGTDDMMPVAMVTACGVQNRDQLQSQGTLH